MQVADRCQRGGSGDGGTSRIRCGRIRECFVGCLRHYGHRQKQYEQRGAAREGTSAFCQTDGGHPPTEAGTLSRGRKVVAWLTLLLFVVLFMPLPMNQR